MKPLKIGFLIDDFSMGGGTERVTSQIASALSEKHSVTIYSMKLSEKIKFGISKKVHLESFHEESINNKWKQRWHTGKSVCQLCRKKEVDVFIIVETYKFLNLAAWLGKIKKTGVKLITWEHFCYCADKTFSVKWWAKYFAAKYSDALVVLGKEDMKQYEKNLKKINRLVCIYNPIAVGISECPNVSGKTVLAVGRLERQKGFDILLNIWKQVEATGLYDDWKLKIVGSGSMEEELRMQAESLQLRCLEMVPFQKDIAPYYREASVMVLTSRHEGFVLVLLEAQAQGLPIVSFDVTQGPGEIIDEGINGYLISPFDEKKFAERLCELMGDLEKRKKFSKNASKDLARFSMENVLSSWENLFKELFSEE